MRLDELRIQGFSDACSALFSIHRRFDRAHAAASLAADGRVLDLTVFTLEHHTIDDALDWANGVTNSDPDVARLVLMSLRPEGVSDIREQDIELLRTARHVFGRSDVEVVDWLLYDGELVRSVAITAGYSSWDQ
ncbi:MAG TPA: hypothetical protein VM840_04475 [Actinomycetota bacterium]|jgi:hypothetical protein|nr:hypothetical protein [Actinomycetota bacterium]